MSLWHIAVIDISCYQCWLFLYYWCGKFYQLTFNIIFKELAHNTFLFRFYPRGGRGGRGGSVRRPRDPPSDGEKDGGQSGGEGGPQGPQRRYRPRRGRGGYRGGGYMRGYMGPPRGMCAYIFFLHFTLTKKELCEN